MSDRRRVVSLVPSSTETLLALGADVVACTRFCEQPDLRHVGGTKNPDIAAIIGLDPDVVVLDREENRREDHDALVEAGITVFVSDVRTVDDATEVVGLLAAVAGFETPLPSRPVAVAGAARRTAFVPIWRRPWMTIGPNTYGASLLRHLGIDLVPTAAGQDGAGGQNGGGDYPSVELEDVASRRPDLVLVPSEPYEFRPDHLTELAEAFVDGTGIVPVDGQDLFWWGMRTPAAVRRLAVALAPSTTSAAVDPVAPDPSAPDPAAADD